MGLLDGYLTNIANAIRTKKGTQAQINAQDFASEISSIGVRYEIIDQWESGSIGSISVTTTKDYVGFIALVCCDNQGSGSYPAWYDMTINGTTPTENYFSRRGFYYDNYRGNGGASYVYFGNIASGSTIAITSNGTICNKGTVIGLL